MSSLQLASVPLVIRNDGTKVLAILEWRKEGRYAAFIQDVSKDHMGANRDEVICDDAPSGLRALADLIEAEKPGPLNN